MTDRFDPYQTLGIASDVTDEQVTAAYRREASKAHPDRPGGSVERMTDVNMAYKILGDRATRAEYDKTGGVAPKDQVLHKARAHLVRMIHTLIRDSAPHADMIAALRDGIGAQQRGCAESRMKTKSELALLRDRLRRLKGPPENFIEGVLLQEIARAEASLPTYDADEEVFKKASEILAEYSYDTSFTVPGDLTRQNMLPGSPFIDAFFVGMMGNRTGG